MTRRLVRAFHFQPNRHIRVLLVAVILGLTATTTMAESDPDDLTLLSIEQLLAVQITGASKYSQKQTDVAAAVSVITREEIIDNGWRNLTEAINSLPGVYSTYDRQYTYIGVRGFGLPGDYNTRVLITINGNRINDSVYDQALMGNGFPVDIDLIERIEFIPGPGGAIYGQNAMLGVINVVTRKGTNLHGTELAVSYQSPQNAGTARVSWGQPLNNGGAILLSASTLTSQGQDLHYQFPGSQTGVTEGIAKGLDGEHNSRLYTRIEQGPWMADATYMDRSKPDPVATYFADPLVAGQYERDRDLFAQLTYNDAVANNVTLSARLFYGQTRYTGQYFFSSVPYQYGSNSEWVGTELNLLFTQWQHHKVMVGMEYQDNLHQDQTVVSVTDYNFLETSHRIGAFAQDEWMLSETLSTTLGVRIDQNSAADTETNPRVGLIWQADPATTLKALYGSAYRAPNAYEQYYQSSSTITNPSLQDEQIHTLEFTGEHRFAPDLKATVSLYQWDLKDLLAYQIDPVSGLSQMQNVGNVQARGVEISADKTWDWGARLRGSVSIQHSSFVNPDHSLDNSPNPLAKLNFTIPWDTAGLKLGGDLQYNGDRLDLTGGTVKGYWLSTLNLTADNWVNGLQVSLGLYNLFNTQYAQPAGPSNWQNTLQQDGRQIRIKAVFAF